MPSKTNRLSNSILRIEQSEESVRKRIKWNKTGQIKQLYDFYLIIYTCLIYNLEGLKENYNLRRSTVKLDIIVGKASVTL